MQVFTSMVWSKLSRWFNELKFLEMGFTFLRNLPILGLTTLGQLIEKSSHLWLLEELSGLNKLYRPTNIDAMFRTVLL